MCAELMLTLRHADCLKDLQRILHKDDAVQRPAFLMLGDFNLAKTDLVPLMVTHPEDLEVVYNSRTSCYRQASYQQCFARLTKPLLLLQ